MRRALPVTSLALVIAIGCQGGSGGFAAEVEWGPEKDGVAVRLLPLQDEYVLGRPMRFRLEMRNETPSTLLYDHQQVGVNHSLIITGSDGKRAPYIRGTCQTSIRGWPAIAPGQTVVLFDKLDAAEQYFIDTPGRYTVQFGGRGLNAGEPPEDVTYSRGRANFPDLDAWRAFSTQIRLGEATRPSNVLEIDVLPGEVPPWRVAAGRVLEALPPGGWEVFQASGGGKLTPDERGLSVVTAVSLHKTGRKGGASIAIHETDGPVEPGALDHRAGGSTSEYWGANDRGHVYVMMPPVAEYAWPEARVKLAAALDVADTAPRTPEEVTRVIELRRALVAREPKEVAALVEAHPEIANAHLDECRVKEVWLTGTPLHWAVQLADVASAKVLLDHAADAGGDCSWNDWTPLHFAATEGSEELAAVLLEYGAEVDAKDKVGKTPLYEAAQKGHGNAVALLLDRGADVNVVVRNLGCRSPLHTAAGGGHRETVKVLLVHGADANAQTRDGRTPLQLAEEKGHADVAEMLRRHGED